MWWADGVIEWAAAARERQLSSELRIRLDRQLLAYSVDKHGLHAVLALADQAIAVRGQIDRAVCSDFQSLVLVSWLDLASGGRSNALTGWAVGNQFGQSPQILDCCSQREFVAGTAEPAQAQAVQPEDALQMCKQHLHLLALAT